MNVSSARQLEETTEDYIRENFKFVKIQEELVCVGVPCGTWYVGPPGTRGSSPEIGLF